MTAVMLESDWLDVAELYRVYWPDRALPQETIEAWYPLLADIDRDDAIAALKALKIGGKPFAPDVAEIRRTVTGPPRRWEDALAELGQAIGRIGAYGAAPRFADPALDRVVTERGWKALCLAVYADSTWRAQFRDAYTAAQNARDAVQVRHMVGLPTGVPRTALPASTHTPAPDADEPVLPAARPMTAAQALTRIRTALTLDDDDTEPLPDDRPDRPSSLGERRARAAAARRRVAKAQEAWSRETRRRLASPEHRRRVEAVIAAVLHGTPQPGPIATRDRPPGPPPADMPALPPPPDHPPEEAM